VVPQIKVFLNSLNDIININYFSIFDIGEIQSIISGNIDEIWDYNMLFNNFLFEKKYYNKKQIDYFIDILINFSKKERSNFLYFTTGSYRLPIGGIKYLNPKITVINLGIFNNL
jgi:E3 ubiquitin-protein ligase TRIP12